MNADKLLTSFAAKVGTPPKREAPDEFGQDDLGSFGWLRGRERAVMLEFRFRNGNIVALGYGWLERVEFDPTVGVTLTFTGEKVVRIAGRNLNAEVRPNVRLIDGLVRQKVPWLQEADRATSMEADHRAAIIERIDVE